MPVVSAPSPRYLCVGTLGGVRDFLLPLLAAGATLFLPFLWIVFAFVIVGQAHFYMTYLYQYRGKRMDSRYLLAAGGLLIAATGYFAVSGALAPLAMLISVLFSFHFAYDEFTLHDERHTASGMATVIGFTFAFFLLTMLYLFPTQTWLTYASAAAGLAALSARFMITRARPTRAERYLWFTGVILFLVAVLAGLPGSILAAIVLLHCANWYIGYGTRLHGQGAKERRYWLEAVGLLGLSVMLFWLFMYGNVSWLAFLYDLAPYYAWAVAHIVLSVITALPHGKTQAA